MISNAGTLSVFGSHDLLTTDGAAASGWSAVENAFIIAIGGHRHGRRDADNGPLARLAIPSSRSDATKCY